MSDDDDDTAANEPIKFGATQEIEAELKLTFPAKYKVRSADRRRREARLRRVSLGLQVRWNEFTSKRTLKFLVREIPQSRADDYAAFRRVVKSDEAQEVSLENTQPGTAAAGGSESAGDLNAAAMQAINNQRFDLAIDLTAARGEAGSEVQVGLGQSGPRLSGAGQGRRGRAGIQEADRDQSVR